MRLNRLGLCLSLAVVLSGCQVIDKLMDIPSGSSSSSSTSLPTNIPTQPPASKTSPKTPNQQEVSSSLVVFVGSTSPVPAYTKVTQKGQTVYVDPTQTLVYSDLRNVLATLDESNYPYVNLEFSATGAQKLSNLSANNIGKHFIVTLNNELISILKIEARNSHGILYVPMGSVSEAQTLERRILDGE